MQDTLRSLLETAVQALQSKNILPDTLAFDVQLQPPKSQDHGDLACNLAMMLAKPAGIAPRVLAQHLIDHLPENTLIERVELAGPGFLNFFLNAGHTEDLLRRILSEPDTFGHVVSQNPASVIVEFVSCNPTGPLHVAHGRHAAYGASLCNILETSGARVHREYYSNDAGRQMNILATSLWLRYLACAGIDLPFPQNGYKGDYLKDIAQDFFQTHQDAFVASKETVLADLPPDATEGGCKETYIDAVIARAKTLLADAFQVFADFALNAILEDIRDDLEAFGVHYDTWFSERTLVTSHAVHDTLEKLKSHTYIKDDAVWFRSSAFGDEKDRVLTRSNGEQTYFANDIAYHQNKLERGFDRLINIWGADHHGYIERLQASIKALSNTDTSPLTVGLVQLVSLYRGEEKLSMSTRAGEFVTLRALREEVGNDAARFFYVSRKLEQPLDFDLELAKSKSQDNPVYYIQYAHARICSVLRQAPKGWSAEQSLPQAHQLTEAHEKALLKHMGQYPKRLAQAADTLAPHLIANYLQELATLFHAYYNAHHFIVEDLNLCSARLGLILAVKHLLSNGLTLLGISQPETM